MGAAIDINGCDVAVVALGLFDRRHKIVVVICVCDTSCCGSLIES